MAGGCVRVGEGSYVMKKAIWRRRVGSGMCMGVSVFLMSWVPLVIAVAGPSVGPFMFQFWYNLTMSVVWFGCLLWVCPDLVRDRRIWWDGVRCLFTRGGVRSMMNGLTWTAFVWASLLLDAALVTVITGGGLMLFVVYRGRHDTLNRYRKLGVYDWLVMGSAVVGVGLVTLSRYGGFVVGGGGWRLLWGLSLAAVAALLVSWVSFKFRLGTDMFRRRCSGGGARFEVGCILVISLVANVPGMLVGLVVGLVFASDYGEVGVSLSGVLSVAVVWMIVVGSVGALGSFASISANVRTADLGVNALQYFRPVLSLVWLWMFATVTVSRADWFVVGAAVVVAVNVLIGLRSGDRAGSGRGFW